MHNTADIENIVLVPSKAQGGSTKILSAVTGKQASTVKENGMALKQRISNLKNVVNTIRGELNVSRLQNLYYFLFGILM